MEDSYSVDEMVVNTLAGLHSSNSSSCHNNSPSEHEEKKLPSAAPNNPKIAPILSSNTTKSEAAGEQVAAVSNIFPPNKIANEENKKKKRKRRTTVHQTFPVNPRVIQVLNKPCGSVNHSYRDFSIVPSDSTNGEKLPSKIKDMSFPQKIHRKFCYNK